MKLFEDITNYGQNFIQKQRGVWDHDRWEQVLKDIQKKGVNITEEVANSIGQMLESFKKVFTSISMDSHEFDEFAAFAKEFVIRQKGMWNHDLWLSFLNDLQKKGISVTEEIASSIGLVLESLKGIYFLLPSVRLTPEQGEIKESDQLKQKEEQPRGLQKKQEGTVVVKLETPVVEKPHTPVVAIASQQPLPVKHVIEGSEIYLKAFPRLQKKGRQNSKKSAMLKRKKLSRKCFKKRIRQKLI